MFDYVNGKFTWVEDYIPRTLSIGNGTPCIYLAIEEKYQQKGEGLTPLVKVGLSRSMGRRRGSLAYTYGVRTVWEIPSSNRYLEQIEAILINWLHHVPTSQYHSPETAFVDAAIVDLIVKDFKMLVEHLTEYFEGA